MSNPLVSATAQAEPGADLGLADSGLDDTGLGAVEASQRLLTEGPNELSRLQRRTLWPIALEVAKDVAALQVAGEHYPGVLLQQRKLVHMAQRPVVVALGCELGQRARGVAGVRGVTLQRGVQHADVEPAGTASG